MLPNRTANFVPAGMENFHHAALNIHKCRQHHRSYSGESVGISFLWLVDARNRNYCEYEIYQTAVRSMELGELLQNLKFCTTKRLSDKKHCPPAHSTTKKAKIEPSEIAHFQFAKEVRHQKSHQLTIRTTEKRLDVVAAAASIIAFKRIDVPLPCVVCCDHGTDEMLMSSCFVESTTPSTDGALRKTISVAAHAVLKNKFGAKLFRFFLKQQAVVPFAGPHSWYTVTFPNVIFFCRRSGTYKTKPSYQTAETKSPRHTLQYNAKK